MKLRKLCYTALCSLLLGATTTACNDDETPDFNDNGSKVELPARRAFIMYEGSLGGNNAGISFYAPAKDAKFISDIYYTQNGTRMGDLANTLIEHDNYLYVVVGGSKYVACLNSAGVELARHAFGSGEGEPRAIDAEDGYVYVTQYGGKISKLKAQTLEVVATFEGGDNLEGIVEENGKLYVANAYKVEGSGNFVYNTEILVINAATMKQEKSLTVVENPEELYEIDDMIYVLSKGNYADVAPALQAIDPRSDKVTYVSDASKVTKGNNGLLYIVCSAYDENWQLTNYFFTLNAADKKEQSFFKGDSFLQNAPQSFSTDAIYLLEVDEETGDIYVGTSDYITNGTIYRFNAAGQLTDTFDAGGINPTTMVFID